MKNPAPSPPSAFRILCAGQWTFERVAAHDSAQEFVLPPPHDELALVHWQAAAADGGRHLFNGPLFRLEHCRAAPERLTLHLGRTCYRDQFYANDHTETLLQNFGEDALPRGLGVSALVITAENDLLLIRRGPHLGEEPGKLDVPGGHAHPGQHDGAGGPDLFRAIRDELQAELDLTAAEIMTNVCCGLVVNLKTHKPDLVFLTHVRKTSREIEAGRAAAVEAEEVAELLAAPNTASALAQFAQRHDHELTPSALACLQLLAKL